MPIHKPAEQFDFIITSVEEPFNKFAGLLWNELNEFDDLVQSWIWLNNRWVSQIKSFNATSVGVSTGYFPLVTNYKYLFKNIEIFFRANQNLTSTTHAKITTQIMKNSTFNSLYTETFNNQISNTSLVRSQKLNLLLTPSGNESIRFLVERFGTSFSVEIGINLNYQLVR